MPTVVPNTVTFETLTLSPNAADTHLPLPAVLPVQTRPAAPWLRTVTRTLELKWDMAAVIALLLTSAAYGVYALLFLTGL